jgi:hypothetical protein
MLKENFVELNKALDKIRVEREQKRRRDDSAAKPENRIQLAKKFGPIPMVIRTKATLFAFYKDVAVKILQNRCAVVRGKMTSYREYLPMCKRVGSAFQEKKLERNPSTMFEFRTQEDH